MSESETDYFLIEGGTAKKLMDEYLAICTVKLKARNAFLKKHKGKNFYAYDGDRAIASVMFEKNPDPLLWKPASKCPGWTPRRTTPDGKALYKEMCGTFPRFTDDESKLGLSLPDFTMVAAKIIGQGSFFWGTRRYHAGFSTFQGKTVIQLPNPFGDKTPSKPINTKNHCSAGYEIKLVDGVRKLKRSEYWAMQEAENNEKLNRKLAKANKAKIPRLRERNKKAAKA